MSDFLWFGSIFTAAEVVTHFIWGISKNRVSVPYILISVGLASLCFYLVWYLYNIRQVKHGSSRFLQPQGKNSLLLYLIHALVLVGLYAIVPVDADLFLVLLVAAGVIIIVRLIGIWLDKKQVYLIL